MKKVIAIAALAAAAGSAFGQAWSEDFEDGLAGWTVVDNAGTGIGWATNVDWAEGNYTNGSGMCASTDSDDFPGEYDSELVSALFKVPTGAIMTASVNYANFANLDFFDIDINTGSGWTNLLSWNEDHGGFYSGPGEDVVLDLSSFAGADAKIRFHHYNPNTSDWDWYVQVDNIAVTPAPSALALLGLGGLIAGRRRR